jgi:hypothetical protein
MYRGVRRRSSGTEWRQFRNRQGNQQQEFNRHSRSSDSGIPANCHSLWSRSCRVQSSRQCVPFAGFRPGLIPMAPIHRFAGVPGTWFSTRRPSGDPVVYCLSCQTKSRRTRACDTAVVSGPESRTAEKHSAAIGCGVSRVTHCRRSHAGPGQSAARSCRQSEFTDDVAIVTFAQISKRLVVDVLADESH